MQKLSLNGDKREFILESGKSDTFMLVVHQVREVFINRTKKVITQCTFKHICRASMVARSVNGLVVKPEDLS